MSLSLLSDTLTFNGKAYKRAYDVATKTWTGTSAAGRQSTTLIDPQGRPLTSHTVGLEPAHYRYDNRGRFTEATAGQADETRTTSIRYYEDGPSNGYVQRGKKGTHTFYSVLSFGHAKNCPSGVFRRPAPHHPAR